MQNVFMSAHHRAMQPPTAHVVQPQQPIVVVVSDNPVLTMSLDVVCNFLEIAVERISSSADLLEVLEERQPMAVVTEMDGRDQDGFHVMMTVAGYDPDLPIMLLTDNDPVLAGAADAVEELWRMTRVTKTAKAAARQQRCPVGDSGGGRLGRSEGGRSPTVDRPNRRRGFSPVV